MAATFMMSGLIWFVQIVHYPLFLKIGEADFISYELDHKRYTSWIVGPLMLVEGIAAISILIWRDSGLSIFWSLLGLFILGFIHLSTILIQVPKHRELSSKFDPKIIQALVKSNWIRTFGWSARSIVATIILMVVV